MDQETRFAGLTPEEQRIYRRAYRKKAYAMTAEERDVMRKYWRLRRTAGRAGLTSGELDARRNVEYREWLRRKGLSPNRFKQKYYDMWLQEGNPK